MNPLEVICPRCGHRHIQPMLYVKDNSCPVCAGLYDADELVLAREPVRALYKPKHAVQGSRSAKSASSADKPEAR